MKQMILAKIINIKNKDGSEKKIKYIDRIGAIAV